MQVLVSGHHYRIPSFENIDESQDIQFIHKEPNAADPTKLDTIHDGTTNEALLEVLIDRMKYLQGKFPCRENAIVLTNLEESLMWLEKRTADRKKRNVEGKHLA